MCYYVQVYESVSGSYPRRVDLQAPTLAAAKMECEDMREALQVGGGALDLWCEGYEEFGREGRMVRTEAGLEWRN